MTNTYDVCKDLKDKAKIINIYGAFWETIDIKQIIDIIKTDTMPSVKKRYSPLLHQIPIIKIKWPVNIRI